MSVCQATFPLPPSSKSMLQINMYVKVLDNTTETLKMGKGARSSLLSDIRQGVPLILSEAMRQCSLKAFKEFMVRFVLKVTKLQNFTVVIHKVFYTSILS